MPDFRIDDTAPEHPKLRAAGLAAAGLWAMAGSYSMGPTQLTDGWVPGYWVATWPGGARSARRLVQAGLWTERERDGMPGYEFHDWLDYQRSRSNVDDERTKARQRMRAVRSRSVRTNNGARSAHVRDSLTLTHTHGSSRGETSPPARAHEPPPQRCPEHIDEPATGPCGPCADARRARQAWEDRDDAEQDAARTALALELVKARADPDQRCDHGTDGGKHVRSDTGESLCSMCRAEAVR